MNIIYNFEEELQKYNLTSETYEQLLQDCSNKVQKITDDDWSEICNRYGLEFNPDTIRKGTQPPLIGSVFVSEYYKWKNSQNKNNDNDYAKDLELQKEEIRKERIKLQTVNIERSRLNRSEARRELYNEYIGNVVSTLPLPDFHPIFTDNNEVNYLVGLADIHYGASFRSVNNEYSTEIAKERMEFLTGKLAKFINDKKISTLTIVSLGDLIQGCLRLSDLKLNDTTIVKATVEVSRLVANMLNELSAFSQIKYYHVPSANHTQIRLLGAKASELADEDLEYLIGNYISDLCSNNDRVNVFLANEGHDYVEPCIPGNEIIAMHGHQIKSTETALKDMSLLHKKFYDCLLIGHLHNGKEIPTYEGINGDGETLICPSFVGSDPYSDTISRGAKASVKIFGFDKLYGHTETYKIILN